ncbi:hypothetical protein BX600DRAFT_390332 [Xylariales sp. PMI_506]|nr:hypothetical protein BX600DRAFT_390332 [Xylariales sp. PMI_506]
MSRPNLIPIDPALFPKINTRRALIVVDAQNDFLSGDGALHVSTPEDLTARIVHLVKVFRPYGDIIWIRSEYDEIRLFKSEQIITSDTPAAGSRRSAPRGRRPQVNPHDQTTATKCPEAFLSGTLPDRAECVRPGTAGAEFPPTVAASIEKKDISLVKTYYSAFKLPQLIQRLRMKFVNTVFICGSLTNVGVMATAIDAGSHGLDISIVEDCCGYRSSERHRSALKRIEKMTGCDVMDTEAVLNLLKPKQKVAPAAPPITSPFARRYPVVYEDRKPENSDNIVATPSNLSAELEKMSLNNTMKKPMNPARIDDLHAGSDHDDSHAEEPIIEAEKVQPQGSAQVTSAENVPEESTETPKLEANVNNPNNKGDVEAALSRLKLVDVESVDLPQASAPSSNVLSPVQELNSTKPQADSPESTLTKDPPESRIEQDSCRIGTATCNMSADKPSAMSEALCEGDTRIHYDVLPSPLCDNIFEKIRDEVQWLRMSHQGGEVPRLVAVQGTVDQDGSIPVYRHPADESPPLLPWTPTVDGIREVVETRVGHQLNHALIQFYRDGSDYISEHSDKTLDIVKDSFIVNVSLGAERTMVFRTKRQSKHQDNPRPTSAVEGAKRAAQRERLPHNSMCQMGLQTNMRWLHAIRQDKRADREKSAEELAYGGARISLTFRKIGTFLDKDQKRIWGQGAKAKGKEDAHEVINGQTPEAVRMLQAFGRENQSTVFDWPESYGEGFDVLHISAAPRLFTSSDTVANMRVQLMLAELSVGHAKGSLAPPSTQPSKVENGGITIADAPLIKFVDNDADKTTVTGDVAIMSYLDRVYCQNGDTATVPSEASMGCGSVRLDEALDLLRKWRPDHNLVALKSDLQAWDAYVADSDFVSGPSMTITDFAFWPVLYDIVARESKQNVLAEYPNLKTYYERIRGRETVIKVFGKEKKEAESV